MAKSLSFEEYKLLKDSPDSFELVHPDGSNFSVAKKGLDDKLLSRIGGMPYYESPIPNATPAETPAAPPAEEKGILGKTWDFLNQPIGKQLQGEPGAHPLQGVKDFLTTPVGQTLGSGTIRKSAPIGGAAAPGTLADNSGGTMVDGETVPLEETVGAPQAGGKLPAPQGLTATVADPNAMPGMGGPNSAFGMQAKGIQDSAAAQAQAAADQAAAYDAQATRLAEEKKRYDESYTKLTTDNDALEKDILDDKIEPNKLLGSMSTGNRMLAGIAIALGGLSQGLSGQARNPALDQLNKFIEQDIEAQKTNMDKKRGLLATNMQKVRDLQTAENITRSQLLAVTQAEVQKAVAKAGSDEAKARGQVLLGQLKQQQDALKAEIAKKAALSQVGMPGVQVNPEGLPEETRERLIVLPNGQQRLVRNKLDVKEITDEISTIKPIYNQLEELERLGASAMVPFSKENQKADAIRANIAMLLKENQNVAKLFQGGGKDGDKVSVLQQFENPKDFKGLLGNPGENQLLRNFLMDKLEGKLSAKLSNYQAPYKPKTQAPGHVAKR